MQLRDTSEFLVQSFMFRLLAVMGTPESERKLQEDTVLAQNMEDSVLACTDLAHILLDSVAKVLASDATPDGDALKIQAMCTGALEHLRNARSVMNMVKNSIKKIKVKRAAASTAAGVASGGEVAGAGASTASVASTH